MAAIFFAFNGTPDELRATGIAEYSGGRWKCVPLSNCLVGILHNGDHADRPAIDSLHPGAVTLPGPSGKLMARHVAAIGKDFPQAKEGDAFGSVLSMVYQKTGDEDFNPDNH